ncbi:non-lysosomal glucosylceramidase-like isoform X4 [Eucalyptus grandis]|uniref:non-lysosomal glucosylceramidase-like isoform X4 n=1 Tax=Eucalyptus grandis TaxID=71139 RepID=UPI00192EE303|nr:non-lysosomal glucosylceramidase-like isoform X4 [Eucalyptus grandis]
MEEESFPLVMLFTVQVFAQFDDMIPSCKTFSAGSIGRSYKGEFQRFQLFPKVSEDVPILANQFYVMVSHPNGKKFSTVLCPKTAGMPKESTGSGTECWDWNLNGDKCTYHALFPRAWTIYDGFQSRKNFCRSLLFTWVNSVGGVSGFSGAHFNSNMETANGDPPVTFAIVAEESSDVHISKCPYFLISGTSHGFTAKDMWYEIKKNGSFDHTVQNDNLVLSEAGSSIGAAMVASLVVPPDLFVQLHFHWHGIAQR